jgi:hypothetical protein
MAKYGRICSTNGRGRRNGNAAGQAKRGIMILQLTASKVEQQSMSMAFCSDFPTVADIAAAWNAKGDASYFHSNRKNGFQTFQDEQIASLPRMVSLR